MKFAIALAFVSTLFGSSSTRADEVERPATEETPSIDVIATQPLALVGRGVSVSYERLVRPRISVVALGGARAAANGDYDSVTWTLGAEVRYWPLSTVMRRLYLGFHVSAGHTSVTDNVMQTTIGSAWGLTQRADIGYRVVVRNRLALTPSLGFAMREDVDMTGRLATTARGVVMLGFELGWISR